MNKIWAILEDLGFDEYDTMYPVVLANNLEAIKVYIEEENLKDPIIVYKELDGVFKCGYIEGNDTYPNWNYWNGIKHLGYTWKNIKTGEVDPFYKDRENIIEEEQNDWEEVYSYEVYKEGKLVKTYFVK